MILPYRDWVPQMMGQGAIPKYQTQKEVRLGEELEQMMGGGDADKEGDEGDEDVEVDEEVEGLEEEEEADVHPSGGASGSSSAPGISLEIQQALVHSEQVLQGVTPSVHTMPLPQLPAAPEVSGTPRVLTAPEKQAITATASKAFEEVRGKWRPTGPQQSTSHLPTPNSDPGPKPLLPLQPQFLQAPVGLMGPLFLLPPLGYLYLLRNISRTFLWLREGHSGRPG